jgi:hypothetical protein
MLQQLTESLTENDSFVEQKENFRKLSITYICKAPAGSEYLCIKYCPNASGGCNLQQKLGDERFYCLGEYN